MRRILLALFMLGIAAFVNAEEEDKIVAGVLEHLKLPKDWKVTAESSYYDSVKGKVIVRRSLLLDISKLIPDGVGLPKVENNNVETKLFYAKLARRFRDDVSKALKPLTSDEFDSMDLDTKPNESPTTTVYYNQDCVLTVMSSPSDLDGDTVFWSVSFVVALDVSNE